MAFMEAVAAVRLATPAMRKQLRAAQDTTHDAVELAPEHLAGFRRSQQLSYACVTAVEKQLRVGTTERDAVEMLDTYMRNNGVNQYFHGPVAWFGDRTAFTNFYSDMQFYPTKRKLEEGMPVILDVAPVVDGYSSDVGYACKLGENALHDQMLADLEPYRALILDGVRAKRTLRAIYFDVNTLIQKQGYQNRHQRYQNRVLGHRVNFVAPKDRTESSLFGFGMPAITYLFGRMAMAKHGAEQHSPFWNDQNDMNHVPEPGLWAVEPHLGFRGVGVKWEELLVVTESDAYWLDDDLPHVRRFKMMNARNQPVNGTVHTELQS